MGKPSTVKVKPATPLPHSHEHGETGSYLKDASGGLIGSARFEHDALYWIHAANAYPKLVAHLQALEAHLKGGAQPAEGKALREQQQALLRDLGEES